MTPEEIAATVERALSLPIDRTEVLAGGEFNVSVLLTTRAGRIVARHPRVTHHWGPDLHGQAAAMDLARGAGVPVAEVMHVDDEVLAYHYVEGRAMSEDDAASGFARRAGEVFARMHAVTGIGLGPVLADGSSPGWPDLTYFTAAAAEAQELLAGHDHSWGIDASDLERAVPMLAAAPPHRSTLVHGDAGIGNIVIGGTGIVAVIDFDNAWFGDPAIDLAWWWWRSPTTAPAFEAGLVEAGDLTDPVRIWSCRVRLLVGLATIFAARMPERARRIGTLLAHAVDELDAVTR